jgi:hypothetical protein
MRPDGSGLNRDPMLRVSSNWGMVLMISRIMLGERRVPRQAISRRDIRGFPRVAPRIRRSVGVTRFAVLLTRHREDRARLGPMASDRSSHQPAIVSRMVTVAVGGGSILNYYC